MTAPDIAGLIDRVLVHLEPNGRCRQSLPHANLLLTNVMALLRPIRIKKQEPGGPKTYTAAGRSGLSVERVRLLKASVFRGVREIESGDYLTARNTFTTAREAWRVLKQRQKPTPEAAED